MESDVQLGMRFSLNYMERGEPTADSETFRARLAAYIRKFNQRQRIDIFAYAAKETGFVTSGDGLNPEGKFTSLRLSQFLDMITVIANAIREVESDDEFEEWVAFAARACREENVSYTVDEHGGVHYLVDQAFSKETAHTLQGLNQARHSAVAHAFEKAMFYLDPASCDPKASIRAIFEALEIFSRNLIGGKNLNKFAAQNALKALAITKLAKNQPEAAVISAMFTAFGEWIDGVHTYRHGQPGTEPADPSIATAVHLVSMGTSYLRLLLALDADDPV